jgi:hypothetical protein
LDCFREGTPFCHITHTDEAPSADITALDVGVRHRPTSTNVPSLKYARNYVSDAKDYNNRARKTNDEIDADIRKLLEGTE